MKETFTIKPHSVIDLITNSSTEMFTAIRDKSLEFVKSFVEELEGKYPPEYNGHRVSVYEDLENSEDYFYESEEETADLLRRNGYTVEKIKDWKPRKVIKISCERGYMNRTLVELIEKEFSVKLTCDG